MESIKANEGLISDTPVSRDIEEVHVLFLTDCYAYWALVDGVLFVIIICGNVLTILAVKLSRRLRSTTSNYFVLSLAVSDFLVGLTLPYHLTFYVNKLLGEIKVTCLLKFVLISLTCSASIYNLIAIAVDRYVAVVHPFKYTRYVTRKAAFTTILIGWLTAITFATVPIYWNCFNTVTQCEIDTVLPRYYIVAVLTPIICLVWVIMFLLYWQIWKEASIHARRLRDNGFYNEGSSDWKSVQVVLLVLGCFSICWLPYFIVASIRFFDWHRKPSPTWYKAMFSLAIANSGMNPMIYAWKNASFRKAFNRLLHFQSPNHNEFDDNMKNYFQNRRKLSKMDSMPERRTNSNNALQTMCDNYAFDNQEAFEVTHI